MSMWRVRALTAFVGVLIGLGLMIADFTAAGLVFMLVSLTLLFLPRERL